jgi:hypothetical protein
VRVALGAKFPEYERALFRAYGAVATFDLDEFRAGKLSKNVIESILESFLLPDDLAAELVTGSHLQIDVRR